MLITVTLRHTTFLSINHTWHIRSIQTYSRRGTKASSTKPYYHSQVYTGDYVPNLLPGERLVKRPIKVLLDEHMADQPLHHTSRLNYARVHSLEHNIRVCPVGKIDESDLKWVLQYYKEANTFEVDGPTK